MDATIKPNEILNILKRLSPQCGFDLDAGGFPQRNKGIGAPLAWANFYLDADGARICMEYHDALLPQRLWIWPMGTIEDALGVTGKGEDAIRESELEILAMSPEVVRARFPYAASFFDWLAKKGDPPV